MKHKKRSSSSTYSKSSDCQEDLKKLKKLRKKIKRAKKEHKQMKHKKRKKNDKDNQIDILKKSLETKSQSSSSITELHMEERNLRAPMTKEEWETQQNVVRKVYDEESGRFRLIKGTGEVLEECVSKEQQKAINKMATKQDGEYFQKTLESLN